MLYENCFPEHWLWITHLFVITEGIGDIIDKNTSSQWNHREKHEFHMAGEWVIHVKSWIPHSIPSFFQPEILPRPGFSSPRSCQQFISTWRFPSANKGSKSLAFLFIHLGEGTLHVQQSWCVEWSCTWDVLPALAWGAKRGKWWFPLSQVELL